MVDLASLVVRLVADVGRFGRDLDRARENLNGFAAQAGAVAKKVGIAAGAAALAVTTGLIAMTKAAIDTADELNDISKITGVSVESLSQLQFAAEQSGTDLEGLTTGLRKFNQQSADAAGGSKQAAASFALIGVSVTDAAGKLKPTEQLLLEVAEKFSRFKDGAGKTAAALDLFGKSGAALIPFLNNGAAGIKELMAEADRLGLTITKKTAVAADEFNDKLNKLSKQFSIVGRAIAERFIEPLLAAVTAIAELMATKSDLTGFLDAIANGFRVVAYVIVATVDAFKDVGRLIGAFEAGKQQLLRGNLAQVQSIYKEYMADAIEAEKKTTELLAKIWGERVETQKKILGPRRLGSYLSESQQYENRNRTGLEKPLEDFPIPAVKAAVDQLQEVEVTLKRVEIADDFYKEFQDRSQTALGRAFDDFKEKKASAQLLLLDNIIDIEEYRKRVKEAEELLLGALTKGPAMAKEEVKKLNEYQVQAARNTQDIIANTFESLANGAGISAKSILQSFGRMIVQLAAQAAAANIAGKLFGSAATGEAGGGSGLLGAALGFLSRDSGGRGRKGQPYMIGKGAQPELFIPDRSGTFMPAGAYGGGVVNNFSIVADEPLSRRTQLQIAAAASRGVERANRRNN